MKVAAAMISLAAGGDAGGAGGGEEEQQHSTATTFGAVSAGGTVIFHARADVGCLGDCVADLAGMLQDKARRAELEVQHIFACDARTREVRKTHVGSIMRGHLRPRPCMLQHTDV